MMRNLLFLILICTISLACKKVEKQEDFGVCGVTNDSPRSNQTSIVMLKVDFTTHSFEGGTELVFPFSPTFNIATTYQSPGDFGSVQLYYAEHDQRIFDGSIIWMGKGEMTYPDSLASASNFQTDTCNTVALPDSSAFSKVMYSDHAYYPDTIQYDSIWSAVSNLRVVSNLFKSPTPPIVHLFLYTPSVGAGDPRDWDWYILLKD